MAAANNSLVIIPTYTEEENIARIIDAVLGLAPEGEPGFDVLVIDDASPDRTAAIVREKMAEHPGRVSLLERPGKLGLGTAYIMGFRHALANPAYDYIFEMDADFSHNPADLPRLRRACMPAAQGGDGADLAVGSRYVSGVNVVNWPMGRVLMSYYASAYVRFVTRMPVHDATAGFVCYTRRALAAYDLSAIRFKGYAFQIEMKFAAHNMGFKIKEVPIVFVNRVLGESKMSKGIFSEGLFGVMRLKLSSLLGRDKSHGATLRAAAPEEKGRNQQRG